MSNLTLALTPNFRTGGFVMGLGIIQIRKLIQHATFAFILHL